MSDDMDEDEVAAAITALAGALARDMARSSSRDLQLVRQDVSDDEATMIGSVGPILSPCTCRGGNQYTREIDADGKRVAEHRESVCIACHGGRVVAEPKPGGET